MTDTHTHFRLTRIRSNDTASACSRDLKPRFSIPTSILPDLSPIRETYNDSASLRRETTVLLHHYPQLRPLALILKDVSRLTQFININAEREPDFFAPKVQRSSSGTWVMPFMHQLLALKPDVSTTEKKGEDEENETKSSLDNGNTETLVHEALRHAIILFLQPMRRKFGIVTDISSAIHIRALREILASGPFDNTPSCPLALLPILHQWLLASGGMEAETVEDQRWFAGRLAALPGFRNARERDSEFGVEVRGFVWVDAIHDGRFGRMVWQVLEVMS